MTRETADVDGDAAGGDEVVALYDGACFASPPAHQQFVLRLEPE